jgi:hypothetical protein
MDIMRRRIEMNCKVVSRSPTSQKRDLGGTAKAVSFQTVVCATSSRPPSASMDVERRKYLKTSAAGLSVAVKAAFRTSHES